MIIMEIQVLKYFIHINIRDCNKFFFIIEFKLSALLNSRIQPSNNYTIEIRANRTPKVLIKIIMIDTNALCREDNGKKSYSTQIEAILQETRRSNISFVVAVGHDPVWTYAGYSKNCLNGKLKPLLHHYNVKAYFGAHDKLFQHVTETHLDTRVEYFTSGNGAYVQTEYESNNDYLGSAAKLRFRGYSGGFIRVQANNTHMIVGFIDSKSVNIYNYAITTSLR